MHVMRAAGSQVCNVHGPEVFPTHTKQKNAFCQLISDLITETMNISFTLFLFSLPFVMENYFPNMKKQEIMYPTLDSQ